MSATQRHQLVEVELAQLRPTQITAGFAEVVQKRIEWAGLAKKARRSLLESHWFPAVVGPRGRYRAIPYR